MSPILLACFIHILLLFCLCLLDFWKFIYFSSSFSSPSSTWSVLLVRLNYTPTSPLLIELFTFRISLWFFSRFSISLLNSSLIFCVYFLLSFRCLCSDFIDFHALFYVAEHSLIILLNSLSGISPNLLSLESIFVKLVCFEEVIFPWFLFFLCFSNEIYESGIRSKIGILKLPCVLSAEVLQCSSRTQFW